MIVSHPIVVRRAGKDVNRGTAWLFGRNWVVTALHVVGADGDWEHDLGGDVRYVAQVNGREIDVKPHRKDAAADLAILQATDAVPKSAGIGWSKLGPPLRFTGKGPSYAASGFAEANPKGFTITGHVARVLDENGGARRYQLQVEENTARLEGMSGAPLVVDGKVAGVVLSVLTDKPVAYAAPIDAVVALLPKQAALTLWRVARRLPRIPLWSWAVIGLLALPLIVGFFMQISPGRARDFQARVELALSAPELDESLRQERDDLWWSIDARMLRLDVDERIHLWRALALATLLDPTVVDEQRHEARKFAVRACKTAVAERGGSGCRGLQACVNLVEHSLFVFDRPGAHDVPTAEMLAEFSSMIEALANDMQCEGDVPWRLLLLTLRAETELRVAIPQQPHLETAWKRPHVKNAIEAVSAAIEESKTAGVHPALLETVVNVSRFAQLLGMDQRMVLPPALHSCENAPKEADFKLVRWLCARHQIESYWMNDTPDCSARKVCESVVDRAAAAARPEDAGTVKLYRRVCGLAAGNDARAKDELVGVALEQGQPEIGLLVGVIHARCASP